MDEKVVDVLDACRILQRSRAQIYNLLKDEKLERRQIKNNRVGRPHTGITLSSITKYIKEN